MIGLRVGTALAALLFGTQAGAASFDCGGQRHADEQAICASRALNDRDVKMSLLYDLDRYFLPMGGRDALIGQQAAWLRGRRSCGADFACLLRTYDRRIAALRAIIDTRVATHGPF